MRFGREHGSLNRGRFGIALFGKRGGNLRG
jgi:hypothetical protein